MSQRHLFYMVGGGILGWFAGNWYANRENSPRTTLTGQMPLVGVALGVVAGWFAAKYI